MRLPSRAFCAIVACVVFASFAAACGKRAEARYADPAAIGDALQANGIVCAYSPMAPGDTGAETAGQCKGSDFVALIYVFATKAERQQVEGASTNYWCGQGQTTGSYVSDDRWLVTLDAPPTKDPNAVYMSDIAQATGGRRVPQRCA